MKKVDTSPLVEAYVKAIKLGNDGEAEMLLKQIIYCSGGINGIL